MRVSADTGRRDVVLLEEKGLNEVNDSYGGGNKGVYLLFRPASGMNKKSDLGWFCLVKTVVTRVK